MTLSGWLSLYDDNDYDYDDYHNDDMIMSFVDTY